MPFHRHSEEELRQFAAQVKSVSVAELRVIEEILLPAEATREFLEGYLMGLGVGYQADEDQRPYIGKVIAVLADRILKTDSDLRLRLTWGHRSQPVTV